MRAKVSQTTIVVEIATLNGLFEFVECDIALNLCLGHLFHPVSSVV